MTCMTGNQAIARGAYEAGVRVATSHPGHPCSEVLETIVNFPEIYSEWSISEKVALEVAIGASIAGSRAICILKNVGLNVAADPLLLFSLTGVGSGLVVVVADDIGIVMSPSEQDDRYYPENRIIRTLFSIYSKIFQK
jgi:indolepyruvate ferredoxin oxidoreductase, alpha subunit